LDLKFSEEYEDFRAEVKAFLAENWPLKGDEAKLDFNQQGALLRNRAIEAGYVARGVPKKYGGSEQGADVLKATIIGQEFSNANAPGELRGIGPSMLVPTLLEKGEEWQKEKFVPPTLRGEMIWCQGYSEPGSGSDLASLQTRGELVGDEWVINGQKIWTTGAHTSDYMFCLVRTEPDVPKHAGISYILIDMRTEGVEVRPLTTMTGTADFNEVFLNDVRVPAKNIVGKRGEGWLVSRATLKHERSMIGGFEAIMGSFRGLVRLAQSVEIDGRPAIEDASIQEQLIEIEGYCEAHRYSGYRQLTLSARGEEPGIAGLLSKLNSTTIGQRTAKLAQSLLGDAAMLAPHRSGGPQPGEVPAASIWTNQFMWTLGISTAGGTANIQRNVIAERGLGLPREPAQEASK
jgi:alkylation response protein AidB-like acyl-CoA dehydrogenase